MLDFENQEIIICGKQCIPALPEGEGAAAVNKPRKKWLHDNVKSIDSTKVEPPKSWRHPITIEEVEDDDAIHMNTKSKLSNNSTYILKDNSDDEQILFDRMEIKTNRKHEKSKVDRNTPEEIPARGGGCKDP